MSPLQSSSLPRICRLVHKHCLDWCCQALHVFCWAFIVWRTRALSDPARSMRLRYESIRGSPRAAAAEPGVALLSTATREMVWLRLLPSL